MSNNDDDEENLPQREVKDTPLFSDHTDRIAPPSITEGGLSTECAPPSDTVEENITQTVVNTPTISTLLLLLLLKVDYLLSMLHLLLWKKALLRRWLIHPRFLQNLFLK